MRWGAFLMFINLYIILYQMKAGITYFVTRGYKDVIICKNYELMALRQMLI